jgi:hypothetical protein
MTTPAFGQPGYTAEQLAQAGQQIQPPPLGTGPDPADLSATVAQGVPTVADISAILAQMQEQQAAMAAEIQRLRAGQRPSGLHPVIGAANSLKDLLATHFDYSLPRGDKDAVLRLADDVTDAASNAFDSGDTGPLRDVSAKLSKALSRIDPGPGEHPYYRQAVAFANVHLPDAADTITGPNPDAQPKPAAVSGAGGKPTQVLQGSVTG